MKSPRSLIASLALGAALLGASSARAEVLPADPLAFPSSGVQHPPVVFVPKAAPVTDSLEYMRNIDEYYGNTNWGGGYRVYENARAPSVDYQSINFDYHARGRLFGRDVEGFRLHGATWNPRSNLRESQMKVLVLGSEIFSDKETSTAQLSSTSVAWNRLPFDQSLARVSKTFNLGPIPVTVSGDLRGSMGVNVAAVAYRNSTTLSGATLYGTAFAELYGRMSTGVGFPGASAGITGQVTLAEVRAAKNIKVERKTATRVDYVNSFRFNIQSLEGQLGVYASLFGARYDKKILDWPGYNYDIFVASQNGSVTF